MADIILPFTVEEGEEMDAKEVQGNFDALASNVGSNNKAITDFKATVVSQLNGIQQSSDQKYSTFYSRKNNQYTKTNVVFVDGNSTVDETHKDDLKIFNVPVFPYVPLNVSESGTIKTFENGGMVICTTATNLTLNDDELASLSFTGFVGILPVSPGTKVTASRTVYFTEY